MKRFRFRLEKILELRQNTEKEAKNELGKAISFLAEIENKIKENAQLQFQAANDRFNSISAFQTEGLSVIAWENYIHRLEFEAEKLMEDAARAELVVEEKRNIYMEASRELKILEKLKEKRREEHREEMIAADAKIMDEMYSGRKNTKNN